MKRVLFLTTAALAGSLALSAPSPAHACGGFFCSAAPVDQNAERIVFAIDDAHDTTDMVVQISYQGADKDFAWLLPVGEVPQNRQVFPNGALGPLDAQTGPQFTGPCSYASTASAGAGSDDGVSSTPPTLTVLVQETVGPYDVVVLESSDATATFDWLTTNGYRLVPAMQPYIELYTAQQMKFLALKLTANATVKDIQPFRMTFNGTTPSIPLRLTAIAAEPEMGLVVWVLGQQRYEPANADEITISDADLVEQSNTYPPRTNWTDLVARGVDAAGGRAWVVDEAGETADLVSLLQSSFANTSDQMAARDALLGLFAGRPYMTRLYTRLSAEEMTYDPSFRKSEKPDVSRTHTLPGHDVCRPSTPDPCAFSACGQLGLCATATNPAGAASTDKVAACACAPGSTARTTFDPNGAPTVACQDQRMSFINPGDKDSAGNTFPDPCVGFDCGSNGRCVSMNLTPTCDCDEGYVAVGSVDATGARKTQCVQPLQAVNKDFYNRRPPALAQGMTPGRAVDVPPVSAAADVPMSPTYGVPAGGVKAPAASPRHDDSGCNAGAHERASWSGGLGLLVLAALLRLRRREVKS